MSKFVQLSLFRGQKQHHYGGFAIAFSPLSHASLVFGCKCATVFDFVRPELHVVVLIIVFVVVLGLVVVVVADTIKKTGAPGALLIASAQLSPLLLIRTTRTGAPSTILIASAQVSAFFIVGTTKTKMPASYVYVGA